MSYESEQFKYDNQDNPNYDTEVVGIDKGIDIDDVVVSFMQYMQVCMTEEINMDIADALWALVKTGIPINNSPISIVVNAAIRWKSELK